MSDGILSTARRRVIINFLLKYNVFIIFIILVIASSLLSDVFLSSGNIFNVLRQQVPYFMIGIGVLLTILTGGIDLSVGAGVALGNCCVALFLVKGNLDSLGGMFGAILLTLLIMLAIGSITGVLVAYLKISPFVATLATMTIMRGIASILTGGSPIRLPMNLTASRVLVSFGQTSDPLTGVPLPVWLAVIVIALFLFIMKYTVYGRLVIATGSNENAVNLAGINVNFYKFSAYAISGIMCGIAGIVLCSRAAIATPTIGSGFELDAIAACVIGGASLSGGRGKVSNTI
ncbi:MAG: ABC transporter permease, partial [Treponema sp.]|nr:ABC transporter permease [Treponema sp.]